MFRKRKLNKQKELHQVLTPDFATTLLDKELQLDNQPSLELIHELVHLYTQAIEFYEIKHDSKFLDFQDRMHRMLVRPDIFDVLQIHNNSKMRKNSFSCSPTSRDKTQNFQNLVAMRKHKQEKRRVKLIKDLNKVLEKPQSRNCQRLVHKHEQTLKDVTKKAVDDFCSQDSSLESRLAQRKVKALSRSMNCSLEFSSLSAIDIRGSSFSDVSVDNLAQDIAENIFQEEMEEIMERNYEKKANEIARIKVEYESKMAEYLEQGDIGKMVVEQMRVQMGEEIKIVSQKLDKERKQEIKVLKEQYKSN